MGHLQDQALAVRKGRTSAKKKSTATAKVFGHGLVLTFDRSKKAGKVKVTVDGKATTLNLFSKSGKPLTASWTFKGALKSHTVVVTVLGTKAAASKGAACLPRRAEGQGLMTTPSTTQTRTGILMSRRTLRAGLAGGLAAGLALLGVAAHADPNPNPNVGTPIAGKAPLDLYAGVGADAFAELSNNFVSQYNTQNPAPTKLLESYDAVNPVTGATGPGENIETKPGCSGIPRPNGANTGLNAIALNQKSTVDPTAFCIDWVRSSRLKGTAAPTRRSRSSRRAATPWGTPWSGTPMPRPPR